ncbi:hypothetical protein CS063_16165 [Sporanaerobium hydrogeniformans]|uniref:Uncharacterized protein n=1 Tax=Sporanaerobium hydrogeniformans TaxID=3072179 RepID=A0AC61D9G1_9FIRM|nr:hypothetical protein [Sporanaerobium hydrogeniformans]PHV69368.1 hypothetical protein CS063_16165 [Sporanaerobium hydrogeniformans]
MKTLKKDRKTLSGGTLFFCILFPFLALVGGGILGQFLITFLYPFINWQRGQGFFFSFLAISSKLSMCNPYSNSFPMDKREEGT